MTNIIEAQGIAKQPKIYSLSQTLTSFAAPTQSSSLATTCLLYTAAVPGIRSVFCKARITQRY